MQQNIIPNSLDNGQKMAVYIAGTCSAHVIKCYRLHTSKSLKEGISGAQCLSCNALLEE